MENTTITARDLLYKILDYGHLWNGPDRIDSKPAQTRLDQIRVLAEAFGVSKKSVNPLKMMQLMMAGKQQDKLFKKVYRFSVFISRGIHTR